MFLSTGQKIRDHLASFFVGGALPVFLGAAPLIYTAASSSPDAQAAAPVMGLALGVCSNVTFAVAAPHCMGVYPKKASMVAGFAAAALAVGIWAYQVQENSAAPSVRPSVGHGFGRVLSDEVPAVIIRPAP